jgi:hypothetical protein
MEDQRVGVENNKNESENMIHDSHEEIHLVNDEAQQREFVKFFSSG